MRFLLFTIVLIFSLGPVAAQQKPYKITFLEGRFNNNDQLQGRIDTTSFKMELIRIKNQLFSRGHLLVNIDRYEMLDSLHAAIYVGPVYYWYAMGVQNIPEEYLSKAGYRARDFVNTEVRLKHFNRFANRILEQATNNGYPFASLQLSNVELNKNYIKGVLDFTPGPMVKFDTLTVQPANLVRAPFLESYLNVKRGALFSYLAISELESSLQALPYARLSEPIELSFANNLCNVSFGLTKVKANRFDAIIGFLPNQGASQGLRLTGYADLHLENLFRAGKSLTFQWQQFQPLSQTILLNYHHPNLFKSPVGFGLEANLVRQDSAFLNTSIAFDVFYARRKTTLAVLSNIVSSRQLSTPTDTTRLPQIADYNMNMFGIDFHYNDLDYLPDPRSGIRFSSSLRFGTKKIRQSPSLPQSIYDSLDLQSNQFQLQINTAVNQGLGKLFALHANLQGGHLWNSDRLFVNDLMRLGGVRSLRGFNEFDLYVSSYTLLRLEFRLLMNEASRLFLFYDQAFTFNQVRDQHDAPLGFGAGLYLPTGAGDLQLIYALGVSQEQSLSLGQAKIHLGYVAKF